MEFNLVTLISVFGAAVASSLHCTAMCGGIVLAATDSKWNLQSAYHGARLVGYLTLGTAAGLLGQTLLLNHQLDSLGIILSVVLGGFLIFSGLAQLTNRKFETQFFGRLVQPLMKYAFLQKPFLKASLIGLASVLLPCGLLYSFILLALATKSLLGGALVLLFFWAGTVPALAGGQLIIRTLINKTHLSGNKIVAVLMIIAGILSIQLRGQSSSLFHSKATNEDQNLQCH